MFGQIYKHKSSGVIPTMCIIGYGLLFLFFSVLLNKKIMYSEGNLVNFYEGKLYSKIYSSIF